jgi:hypothetical protein
MAMTCEDQRMLLTPLPGADRTNLLQALQHVYDGAVNARSWAGQNVDR